MHNSQTQSVTYVSLACLHLGQIDLVANVAATAMP